MEDNKKTIAAPRKITSLSLMLYSDEDSCFKVGGIEWISSGIEWISIESGVRQGYVEVRDPLTVDPLMTRICERVSGVRFGHCNHTDVEYTIDATNC